MTRLPRPARILLVALLLGTKADSCQLTTGANGLCAGFRLDPAKASLHVGESLLIRVNPTGCVGGGSCTCNSPVNGFSWRTSAPAVASVDPSGTVWALKEGMADISAFAAETDLAPQASLRIAVIP